MKKLVIAALAVSLVSTPAMAAPFQRHDNRAQVAHKFDSHKFDHHSDYRQVQHRRWNKGERFDHRQARNYRVISNPRAYHFRDAPRGYRWVQSGNDAVLVGITSGIIASVLINALR